MFMALFIFGIYLWRSNKTSTTGASSSGTDQQSASIYEGGAGATSSSAAAAGSNSRGVNAGKVSKDKYSDSEGADSDEDQSPSAGGGGGKGSTVYRSMKKAVAKGLSSMASMTSPRDTGGDSWNDEMSSNSLKSRRRAAIEDRARVRVSGFSGDQKYLNGTYDNANDHLLTFSRKRPRSQTQIHLWRKDPSDNESEWVLELIEEDSGSGIIVAQTQDRVEDPRDAGGWKYQTGEKLGGKLTRSTGVVKVE